MAYVLALDQGTTSSRAICFDETGSVQSLAQREFEQIYPKPGWIEHDPNAIWASQRDVALEALAQANLTSREVAAIGITNQRETTLIWNRATGQPIHNAIVWQDRRTADICRRLRNDGLGPTFQAKTGLIVDPYFAGTKIRWLLDQVEGAQARAEAGELAFGTVDSWLVWNLTNGQSHLTDVTNASRTLLFNLTTGNWDDELLEILNVPRALLPEVRPSSEVYAETAIDAFEAPIPIAGIAGDQQAALFGQVCTQPGMAKNTYGTGCFLLMNTGTEPMASDNQLLSTTAWGLDGRTEYALEGSIFVAGAVVQWLRDGLGVIQDASDVEALAQEVDDNNGVYLVPAFAGLGAPHWDPDARGLIIGLSRDATAAHVARAALESIAYQVADVVEAMNADAGIPLRELRVDGGAAANDLLMQFQADLLGVPVVRPQLFETTALGAAYLAGLAVDYWASLEEIAANWQVDRTFEPQMARDRVEDLQAGWHRALARSRGWAGEANR